MSLKIVINLSNNLYPYLVKLFCANTLRFSFFRSSSLLFVVFSLGRPLFLSSPSFFIQKKKEEMENNNKKLLGVGAAAVAALFVARKMMAKKQGSGRRKRPELTPEQKKKLRVCEQKRKTNKTKAFQNKIKIKTEVPSSFFSLFTILLSFSLSFSFFFSHSLRSRRMLCRLSGNSSFPNASLPKEKMVFLSLSFFFSYFTPSFLFSSFSFLTLPSSPQEKVPTTSSSWFSFASFVLAS